MWKNVLICWSCWQQEKGMATPARMKNAPSERCHRCGWHTSSGIYVREFVTDQQAASLPENRKPS